MFGEVSRVRAEFEPVDPVDIFNQVYPHGFHPSVTFAGDQIVICRKLVDLFLAQPGIAGACTRAALVGITPFQDRISGPLCAVFVALVVFTIGDVSTLISAQPLTGGSFQVTVVGSLIRHFSFK